ncbi:MAG: acyltransferase family protein [Clostridiales bacterium]|nr:acyltransferase family protein [Clostridiales bacterium]
MTEQNCAEEKETQGRVLYYDVLRILATLFVVVIHVTSGGWGAVSVNTAEWQIMNVFQSAARWSVPVFAMISGALFLDRDIPIRKIYSRYILRLVLSFAAWSAVYAVSFYFFGKEPSLKNLITSFFKGHFHLWFIYMIIGLYMIIPFLKKIVSNEKLTQYFLLLSFVFALVIPQAINSIKMFSSNYGDWIEQVINQAHLKFVLGYSFYFVAGYYISKNTISSRQCIIMCITGLAGFILTAVSTSVASISKGTGTQVFYDYLTMNAALEAVCAFAVLKKLLSGKTFKGRFGLAVRELSKYTFGIYLVHVLVITVFIRLGVTALSFNPLISIPAISILVFIISGIISAVLNHIPIVRDYLV